ncbi:MAG: PD-(D/E)XK nuclease family protein [Steroidobacteraceae bacterium]
MLEQGGTVVVPNRQRAVAVRLMHTRAKLRAGISAWSSSDVLPFSAWLARIAAQSRHGSLRGLRQLGSTEEWLLWRDAAQVACEGVDIMQPASMADALRHSAMLIRDWGLHWPGNPTTESWVLARARAEVLRRCTELEAYAAGDWTRVLRDAAPQPAPLLFAGCESFGPSLRAALLHVGAEFIAVDSAQATRREMTSAGASTVACAHAGDELRRAAQWCRAGLARNAAARYLVVVPQLLQLRAAAVLAFDHELNAGASLSGGGEPPFVIEGGRGFDEYPMVATALALLRLGGEALPFAELGPVLRSPYWGGGGRAQRASLELLLRDRNAHVADLAHLAGFSRNQRGDAGLLSADAFEALASACVTIMPRGLRAPASAWARRFADALVAFQWPGTAELGSDEQQQHERFRELLEELSVLGAGAGPLMTHREAIDLLANMTQRTAFEAASEDVPVTLTDSLDDPLVPYDGIWVTGLGAESWPAPPRPDPFIPVPVQRAAALPHASAQGQHSLALLSMQAWRRSAAQLVLSWPETDGDVVLQPSSLVAAPRGRDDPFAAPPPLADPLLSALRRDTVREARPSQRALEWDRQRALPKGTRTLELQSLCPFRATAELRLDAAPVAEPVPGFDRRERGHILHRALQRVWDELRDSRTLRAQVARPEGLAPLVQAACAQSMRESLSRRAQPLPLPLVQNELQRLDALITEMLQQECERSGVAEFSVAQAEQAQQGALAGVPLRVRMDRLDRLDDGRHIVIDYKSGRDTAFRPLDDRPHQPQLLAYALLAAAEVAGVAAVHLRAGKVAWRGAAAEPALLPSLIAVRGPSLPWNEQLAHWRTVIDRLVEQFVSGTSDVDPRAGACRLCHLPALCRIDGARHLAAEIPDADESENDNGNGDGN